MGMHLQGHLGNVSAATSALSDFGLLYGTSVSSAYDLVEQYESLGDVDIIDTDLLLSGTVVSMDTAIRQ